MSETSSFKRFKVPTVESTAIYFHLVRLNSVEWSLEIQLKDMDSIIRNNIPEERQFS